MVLLDSSIWRNRDCFLFSACWRYETSWFFFSAIEASYVFTFSWMSTSMS